MTHEPIFEASTAAELPSVISLFARLPRLEAQDRIGWVHLAHEGEWKGHHQGPFKFTKEIFSQVLKNFQSRKNTVNCTYGHPEENSGLPVPSSGEILSLEVRSCSQHGQELWGQVKFTEKSAHMVKAEELRFCSVEIDFAAEDRTTKKPIGAELIQLGLTNNPFLDGQHQIKLSFIKKSRNANKEPDIYNQRNSKRMSNKALIEKAFLELGDDATMKDVMSFVDAEKSKATKLALDEATTTLLDKFASTLEMSPDEVLSAMDEHFDAVVAALQGSEEETEEAPPSEEPADVSANTETKNSETKEIATARLSAVQAKVSERDVKIKKLSAQVKTLQDKQIEREIGDAITEGHFLENDRKRLVKLGASNPELLREWLTEGKEKPAVPREDIYESKTKDEAFSKVDEKDLAPYLRQFAAIYSDPKQRREEAIKAAEDFKKKQSN